MDPRLILAAAVFVLVESSVWTLVEGLPRWFLAATILVGTAAMFSLNAATWWGDYHVAFDRTSVCLGFIYVVLVTYAIGSASRHVKVEEVSPRLVVRDINCEPMPNMRGLFANTKCMGVYVTIRNDPPTTDPAGHAENMVAQLRLFDAKGEMEFDHVEKVLWRGIENPDRIRMNESIGVYVVLKYEGVTLIAIPRAEMRTLPKEDAATYFRYPAGKYVLALSLRGDRFRQEFRFLVDAPDDKFLPPSVAAM